MAALVLWLASELEPRALEILGAILSQGARAANYSQPEMPNQTSQSFALAFAVKFVMGGLLR
jgi:hypothetical protein